jgi:Uma2 family endonuclease
VVCGTPDYEDAQADTLLNPTVIIEVLSPSTERYDRGDKFQHYRTLDSLQEYVLISQSSYRIERYLRQSDSQWLLTDAVGLEAALELSSIGCALRLAEVYEKAEIEE